MKSLLTALTAVVLLASACGSSSTPLPAVERQDADDPATADTDDTGAERDGTDEFDAFTQGVIDGIMASGMSRDAAECVVTELDERNVDLLSLAARIDDGELPDELFAATMACGDEIGFDLGDTGFGDPSAMTYGDDPELDRLWDGCAAGDLEDCDELYWTSAIDSDYETFGSTCGNSQEPTAGGCADPSDFGGIDTYGDDADLDLLWDDCAAGDGTACDNLYWTSPLDSGYEAFGASCGDRFDQTTAGSCEEGIGGTSGGTDYGDDPELDALWDECANGDGAACDQLYFQSPFDSAYEAFGDTCGNRFPGGVVSCETEIGAG